MRLEHEVSVELSEGICENCGNKREVYNLSGFLYGIRLLLTKDGKYYAYLNCFEDAAFNEVDLLMINIIGNKTMTQEQRSDCFNKIFGIACDSVKGSKIDASRLKVACLICGSEQVELKETFPPTIKKVQIPIVTHESWNQMDKEEKHLSIRDALNQKCNILQ